MNYYEFNFKKGNVVLELRSTDVSFIKKQMEKNFEYLTVNINKTEKKASKKTAKKAKKVEVAEVIETKVEDIKEEVNKEPVIDITEEVVDLKEVEIEEELPEEELISPISAEEISIDPVKVQEELPNLTFQEVDEEQTVEKIKKETEPQTFISNDLATQFDKVLEEKYIELDKLAQDETKNDSEDKISEEPIAIDDNLDIEITKDTVNPEENLLDDENFEEAKSLVYSSEEKDVEVLEKVNLKSINQDISNIESLEDLIDIYNPKELDEYLIVTAYYLKAQEKLEKYSLKQINMKCFKYSKRPVDHAILQGAVVNNLISIVPDLSGSAEVTEYVITEKGELYLVNGFKG